MAQRRMFSQKIVASDAFIDMPVSARELYFQLGMYADDDGFINPKKVIRMIGSSEDDLKLLIIKRFVLPFENGVVVIKHWKINNLIRKDFYEETIYLEQKKMLTLKQNKAYTEKSKQNVNNLLTQYSIDKDSIDNINNNAASKEDSKRENKEIVTIFDEFKKINPSTNYGNITQRKAIKWLIGEYGFEKALGTVKYAISIQGETYAPLITTPHQLKEKIAALMIFYNKKPKTFF